MVIPVRATNAVQLLGADAGGAVMATGAVSVAMHADGREMISRSLLALTAIEWALLGIVFLGRVLIDRRRWREEARQVSSLTAVAGTAVLGVRLTLLGWYWAGWMLLAIATAVWLILLGGCKVYSRPGTGAGFLVVVAPQSLAVLAAALADRPELHALVIGALLVFALGLGAYVVMLARFDFAQLRTGAGDHWVAGGAIAISTLACAKLAHATSTALPSSGLHDPLRIAGVMLWTMSIAWLPVLIGAEVRWVRTRYDARRWATVFPLGMYSVMSMTAGGATGSTWMLAFGRAWAWVALAAWIATALAAGRAMHRRDSGPVHTLPPRSAAARGADRSRSSAARPRR
jgi:tellurite resistance protein TehA-like permease